MNWTQLWVHGTNATPQSMKRADDHIQQYGAVFCAPNGTPVQEADGTWEVRIYGPQAGFVKFVLTTHYGLEVVREETHADED